MNYQKIFTQLPDILFTAFPLIGFVAFGWSASNALLALMFGIALQTVIAIVYSTFSLQRSIQPAQAISNISEQLRVFSQRFLNIYLVIMTNLLACAVLLGLFLLPPIVLEDPYLMYNTTYDMEFFRRLLHIGSGIDWTWLLMIFSVSVPSLRAARQLFTQLPQHIGTIRIIDFPWVWFGAQSGNLINPWVVGVGVMTYALYYFAFQAESILALLIIITVWRIGTNVFLLRPQR